MNYYLFCFLWKQCIYIGIAIKAILLDNSIYRSQIMGICILYGTIDEKIIRSGSTAEARGK